MDGDDTRDTRTGVLVTGSAGYVGTALVQALAPDYEVIGLDRKAPRTPAQARISSSAIVQDLRRQVANATVLYLNYKHYQLADEWWARDIVRTGDGLCGADRPPAR